MTAMNSRRLNASLVPWTVSDPAAPALVCLSWAGAGAAPFRSWAPLLADTVSCYGIRLAGRESRRGEPLMTEVTEMVAEIVRNVLSLGHGRVALFGHCSGAIAAFEAARALGPSVVALFVASQLPPPVAAAAATGELLSSEGLAARYLGSELLGEPDLIEVLVPILQADIRAVSEYVYDGGRRLDVPLFVYRGSDDPEISRSDLDGWQAETTARTRTRDVDGADHLFTGVAWQALGRQISEDLSGVLLPGVGKDQL